jgi:hypothetical protein
VVLTVTLLSVSACSGDEVGQSPKIVAKYANPETGAARLLAHVTARGDGIVNVTNNYPDADGKVVGASVLVDRAIGQGETRAGFRRRPVLVVYVDAHAAKRAVRSRPHKSYLLRARGSYICLQSFR